MIENNYIAQIKDGKCEDAKSRIIKAALDEFAINSLAAARTRKIAAKAGVNHAAINYYFGGKNELYCEIARQITDYIKEFTKDFFSRADEIYKTRSAKDAKELIYDYLISRICVESHAGGELLRNIILIITREEVYETKVFDIFYKGAFKRSGDMLMNLVEIASCGKLKDESARITSQMLMGQIHMFNAARVTFKRMNGWKTLGEAEYEKVANTLLAIIDKIFA